MIFLSEESNPSEPTFMEVLNTVNLDLFLSHPEVLEKQIKLDQLMNYFNYKVPLFILEHNECIYDQINWNKIVLQNHDKIEIITVVGGG